MTFHVGQKVCCVKADGGGHHPLGYVSDTPLMEGNIYIVMSLPSDVGCIAVGGVDGKWCESRFRPIVERKTSIEIFTSMLNPSKVEA